MLSDLPDDLLQHITAEAPPTMLALAAVDRRLRRWANGEMERQERRLANLLERVPCLDPAGWQWQRRATIVWMLVDGLDVARSALAERGDDAPSV